MRTFTELMRYKTFEDRFHYLALHGEVGLATFGYDRYLNQKFYSSREWRRLRNHIIDRDYGCDLGVEGYEIHSRLLIHHINAITIEDIVEGSEYALDPEYLITTTHQTHNAIHYGDERLLPRRHVERTRNDTALWPSTRRKHDHGRHHPSSDRDRSGHQQGD